MKHMGWRYKEMESEIEETREAGKFANMMITSNVKSERG